MKSARRKLEIPMPAAMPCRLQLNQHRGTSGTVGQHKTKYAYIVDAGESLRIRMKWSQSKKLEADESTRMRMGNSMPHCHEDHIAGKGMNSLSHTILCTNCQAEGEAKVVE